ncbi:hypothetical protein KR215_005816, partial [Drosophila sulfurigaster]
MNSLYQIEKLEEKNYDSWCIHMRCVLVHAELWQLASGALKLEDASEGFDWHGKDSKALAMITLSVKTSQLSYIKNCTTSFAAWTKLKEVHLPSGPVRKVALYKKLLGLKMSECGDVNGYLQTFGEVLDQLAGFGIQIGDELRGIILLSSLPRNYENFVVAIETRDELPSYEILCIK